MESHKKQDIYYKIIDSSLGKILIAGTEKGVCSVKMGADEEILCKELKQEFQQVLLDPENNNLLKWEKILNNYLEGKGSLEKIPYDARSTRFKEKVWRFLYEIPMGTTYHYGEVAEAIGHPKAYRAVASACATNPVALIVACHRILPKNKSGGGYRWGVERKQQLLELEARL